MQETTWKIMLAVSIVIIITLIGYIFIYKPKTSNTNMMDLYIYQGAADVHSIISNDLFPTAGWLLRFKFSASAIPLTGYKEINLRLVNNNKYTGYGFDGVSASTSNMPGLKIYVRAIGAPENKLCFQSAKYNYTSGISTIIYNLGDCAPGDYKKMPEASWIKDITCYPEKLQKWKWNRVDIHYTTSPTRIWYGNNPPNNWIYAGRFHCFPDENVLDVEGNGITKVKLGLWEITAANSTGTVEKSRIISSDIPDQTLAPVLISDLFLPVSKADAFCSRQWFLLKSKYRQQTKFVLNLGYILEQTKLLNSEWTLVGTYNILYGNTETDYFKLY